MATNTLVEYNPFEVSFDPQESRIRNVIGDMVAFTQSLVVDNETAYKKITALYRQAKEWKKVVDTKRKELTEPLRRQTSLINDKAKELTDPLDAVIDMANSKSNGYVRLLEEAKKKEDETLRQAASLFDAEEELYIPPMEKTLRGQGAMTVSKVEKRFKVTDVTKVPAKYLTINESAVKKDLALGIMEIPGLEIYEETTTSLRLR